MKCEVCHKAEAAEAIVREDIEEEYELYVCATCAKAVREQRQRKSSQTRKVIEIGEEDEPPPIIGAIMDAFKDIARGLENMEKVAAEQSSRPQSKEYEIPATRAASNYRVCGGFHLEGLNLIGEMGAIKRAVNALGMELKGISADGINDAGHVYRIFYSGSVDTARRVAEDILREEKNARVRLKDEMKRIFSDAVCRALAILKNCRLLSSGELFDLLSPLRLAAKARMLEGITLAEIERMMSELDLTNSEDQLSPEERDRADGERADEMNRQFEEVLLDDAF